jgi:4-amino-4-deoxy-L-arabinose transferase-like glycosyltransferase
MSLLRTPFIDKKYAIWGVLIAFILLYFFYLGIPAIWEGDDSIHAEISHQMFERNDLMAPYFNYTELRFDKPPLTFWINVFFFKLFGMNEFTTRMGSALFGVFGLWLVYLFGKKLYNRRTGILAALILGTSIIYFLETQLTLLDTALTFFISLTIYWFYIGYYEGKRFFLSLLGVPLGLGILTKGPVVLLLSGGVGIVLWSYHTLKRQKKWNELFNWQLTVGLIVAALICVPWYLAMWQRFGEAFIQSHFGYHMFARFTTAIEDHGGNQWYFYLYYVMMLFIGLFPWSTHMIGSIRLAIKQASNSSSFLLLVWAAVIFVFFNIAQTKLPGYVVPMLPPIAILTGYWWDQLLSGKIARVNLWVGNLVQIIIILIFTVTVFSFKHLFPPGNEALFWIVLSLPACLLVGSIIILSLYVIGRKSLVYFKVTFITFYLFWALFLVIITSSAQGFQSVKYLAPAIKKYATSNDVIAINTLGALSAPFYLGRRVEILGNDQEFFNLFQSKARVFAVTDGQHLAYLQTNHIPFYRLASEGYNFLISNRPIKY